MSSNEHRIPDFFIIGAAKAGTTSIFAVLSHHPCVYFPSSKEPEFFARDDLYDQGLASYSALFSAAGKDQLVGEASTIYSLSPFFPKSAARIHEHAPGAKIIYVVRDPIERAFSYYTQIIKNYQNSSKDYQVHRSFEEFTNPDLHRQAAPRDKVFAQFDTHLPDTPELCLSGSDYAFQINRYLEYFPREQILILRFEDFLNDRKTFFAAITDFLGISDIPQDLLEEKDSRQNVSLDHFEAKARFDKIGRFSKSFGPLWLLRKLVPSRLRSHLRRVFFGVVGYDSAPTRPKPMQPETRRILEQRFAKQMDELDDLCGIRYEF